MYFIGLIVAVLIFIIMSSIKILSEYERGVVFRLGRSIGAKGPGLVILIPFVDQMYKIGMRTITMDIASQDVITQDNVTVKVNAVVYFRVIDPEKAVIDVEDYYFAANQLSQTTLRAVLGQVDLDTLLGDRDAINHRLQDILDRQTEPWGIKVSIVEVKNVDLPPEMQRAMARQAEAERDRRAVVIHAEGEVQRSKKLAEASNVMAGSPSALQLAYLQSLQDVANSPNNTIVFPVPMDMMKAFYDRVKQDVKS